MKDRRENWREHEKDMLKDLAKLTLSRSKKEVQEWSNFYNGELAKAKARVALIKRIMENPEKELQDAEDLVEYLNNRWTVLKIMREKK